MRFKKVVIVLLLCRMLQFFRIFMMLSYILYSYCEWYMSYVDVCGRNKWTSVRFTDGSIAFGEVLFHDFMMICCTPVSHNLWCYLGYVRITLDQLGIMQLASKYYFYNILIWKLKIRKKNQSWFSQLHSNGTSPVFLFQLDSLFSGWHLWHFNVFLWHHLLLKSKIMKISPEYSFLSNGIRMT